MNFLVISHYPVYGGPHSQTERLNKPLAERNWHTVAVLPNETGNAAARLRLGGVQVAVIQLHRLRAQADPRLHVRLFANLPADISRIRSLIREFAIDLVVVNGLVNPHGAIAAHLEGTPVVWQILDTRVPIAVRRVLMPLVNRLADSAIFWGRGLVASHPGAERLGDRLLVTMPPVDTNLFRPDPAKRVEARRLLGYRESDLVVGNIGNLNLQKGHLNFVRSAAVLRTLYPKARFLILGATYPPHVSYAKSVLKLAQSLGLNVGSDLVVRDPGDQVAFLALAMDIFWLTSEPRSEGIPTVVAEAMALGIPVVAADVGAVRELVRDGVSGFVVPPRDADALAERTGAILKSPDLMGQLTSYARRQTIELNSLDVCADIHVAAFNTALTYAASRHDKTARKAVRD